MNEIIYKFRKAKGLTQQQLAEKLHTTAKTVSNWERKRTCVNADIVSDFIRAFDIQKDCFFTEYKHLVFSEDTVKFYCCPTCGNVTWRFTDEPLICCNNKLSPLVPQPGKSEHYIHSEYSDDKRFCNLTSTHPMKNNHHIKFIAYVAGKTVLMTAPEPSHMLESTIPIMSGGKLYLFCTKHGLFENSVL